MICRSDAGMRRKYHVNFGLERDSIGLGCAFLDRQFSWYARFGFALAQDGCRLSPTLLFINGPR